MRNTSLQNEVSLREIASIVLTAWGTIYFISGMAGVNIKATLKTIIGGFLLYKGISGYREAHDISCRQIVENDEAVTVTETDVILTPVNPTIE